MLIRLRICAGSSAHMLFACNKIRFSRAQAQNDFPLVVRPHYFLGSCGERLFIFMELGGTGNHLRGAGEQVHTFGD